MKIKIMFFFYFEANNKINYALWLNEILESYL